MTIITVSYRCFHCVTERAELYKKLRAKSMEHGDKILTVSRFYKAKR